MFSETATGFRPVLRVNLTRYIFKLMTHYMHSGLLMKTLVHFFSFFCAITGHTAGPPGVRADLFSRGVLVCSGCRGLLYSSVADNHTLLRMEK